MLRILRIICDIGVFVSLFLTLAMLVMIFHQTSGIALPGPFIQTLDHLTHPFAVQMRQMVGVHYSTFQGRPFETTYTLLVVVFTCFFVLSVALSTIFHGLDQTLQTVWRRVSHRLFLWNLDRTKTQYAGQVFQTEIEAPESEAIVAYSLENVDKYPQLQGVLQEALDQLRPVQHIYRDTDRMMLRFASSREAVDFIVQFAKQFHHQSNHMRLLVEYPPVFRFAVHSLPNPTGLMEDESFIWALLKCVAANQVYLSEEAKTHFEKQQLPHTFQRQLSADFVGTFSQLGKRTFPNVYRLDSMSPI